MVARRLATTVLMAVKIARGQSRTDALEDADLRRSQEQPGVVCGRLGARSGGCTEPKQCRSKRSSGRWEARRTPQAGSAIGGPGIWRALIGSLVDEVEPRIRELITDWPKMPTTVIAERLGWKHSIRILRDRVREVRPAHLSLDPVSRTTYQPGEICQRYLSFPDIIGPVDERQH